jgi:hypothetical protein
MHGMLHLNKIDSAELIVKEQHVHNTLMINHKELHHMMHNPTHNI